MPLFPSELNAVANYIGRSDLTFWLHTADPTAADPTNGRTTAGGTAYENGKTVAAGSITDAVFGDIEVNIDIDFGTADEAVGTVIALSAVRGADEVGWRTIASTAIADGDSFKINTGTLVFNLSTT